MIGNCSARPRESGDPGKSRLIRLRGMSENRESREGNKPCRTSLVTAGHVHWRLSRPALMVGEASAQNCAKHAQDQCRRGGGAAERGAHGALCGEGARAFRQALHRRQHHPVRRRAVADRERRGGAGLRHHQRQRRAGRPRHEGAADLGPRAAHAAGLHGAGRHHQTPKQLKGKRLSATGGGVGGFNWRMGRAVLRSVGLDVNDAQFIPSPTAGRLPGLIANQVDAVALHPEDVFLAQQKKPTLNVLVQLADLMPLYMFNSYGASLAWIERDRPLLRRRGRGHDRGQPHDVQRSRQGDRRDRRRHQEAEGRSRIRHRAADQELRLVGQRGPRSRSARNGRSTIRSRTATSSPRPSRRSSRSPTWRWRGEAVEKAGGRKTFGNCSI